MSKENNNLYDFDNSSKESILQDIRELEFALTELNLYLDTHPNNRRALRDYNCVNKALIELKKHYSKKYGQLSSYSFSENSDCSWNWIEGPWPWE